MKRPPNQRQPLPTPLAKTNLSLFEQWLSSLVHWIQSWFKKPVGVTQGQIIKTIKSEDGRSLLLDLRRSSPGAVRTLRINSTALVGSSFLITMDNLLTLNKLAQRRRGNQLGVTYSSVIKVNKPTHRLAVTILKISGGKSEIVGVWDANLIRVDAGVENAAAARIAFMLAYRLLMSLEEFYDLELPQVTNPSWWEERLALIIKNDLGVYHVANLIRVDAQD